MDVFLKHAAQAYTIDYFGVIIVLSLLEWVVPRRSPGDTLRIRWVGNIGLGILDAILLRALFPLVGVAWAALCSERGWGMFNQVSVPTWLALCSTILALDFSAYVQHYVLHKVPSLWRLHRTHHTDQDYDFTTGLRFHPLEAAYTTCGSLAVILILGAPPSAVLISQLVTVASSFFEHGNVHMPASLDRVIRLFLVTPDMHRIHHSQRGAENRSNFGGVYPWWDRLFGTYTSQPADGHHRMAFGLSEFSGRKHLTLHWMLAQPFLRTSPQAANPNRAGTEKAGPTLPGPEFG